jgi:hypothetical protein
MKRRAADVGNVIRVRDIATPAVFFGGTRQRRSRLRPRCASAGSCAPKAASTPRSCRTAPTSRSPAPHVQALRIYREAYDYDDAGNIPRMVHRQLDQQGPQTVWTRRYDYEPQSNRLLPSALT